MDSIARKFGIDTAKLRDINGLSANNIANNTPLLVPVQSEGNSDAMIAIADHGQISMPSTASPPSSTIRHTVKAGDTISNIAKKYSISTQQILSANGLKSSNLKLGQSLVITSSQSTTSQAKSVATRHYVVKRGDTLDSIARKFDVQSKDLRRWNKLTGSQIAPGNKLTVSRPGEA